MLNYKNNNLKMNIIAKSLKTLYKGRTFYNEYYKCRDSNIKFYNFWNYSTPEEMCFHKYILQRKLLPENKKIAIYSCLIDIFYTKLLTYYLNIFFTR